jgi:hypothetical protein
MTATFKSQATQRPTAMGSLLQASAYGATIPVGYGQTQSNLLAIWAANLRQGGLGIKKFKQLKKGITNYCENIDFLLGHNPIRGVLQVMNNGSNIPLAFTQQAFSGSGGRQSFTVSDPNFYFVIAVTLTATYSFSVDDYGGQGPQTLSGSWEIPLWNELEVGPDPTDPMSYRCWPFCYRWQQGMGATIYLDAESFPAGTVNVYYAQLTAATSNEPPIAKLAMAFEPQLGSGDEYSDAGLSAQQIIYPHFAGLESSELDLGATGALPSLNPEVAFKWGVYPSGDADFVDMIEDIYKSGMAQAAIAAETSVQPQPAATQMERGLSSYDLPGTIQKKVDASSTAALPAMMYDMPNAQGNVLVATATGAGTLGISSTNGETWTKVYGDGLGYQVWYAYAAGGPNTVTVSGASTPWAMGILEIGGVGASSPNSVLVLPTSNSNHATHGPTSSGTAISSNSGGSMGGSTTYPPFNLYTGFYTTLAWGGFVWPTLPAGAVVISIKPVVSYSSSGGGTPSGALGFLPAPYAGGSTGWCGGTFPALGTSGTFTGPSIGTTPAAMAAFEPGFYFQVTNQLSNTTADFTVSSIALLVSYTVPAGYLGGETVDAVATSSSGPAQASSSVAEGLPGYLLAISLYPGGGATPVADEPLWRAVTPANFAGQSPPTFQMQERIIHSPGAFSAAGAGGAPVSIALLAIKAAQPPPYPKPLGDFIDIPSFDLVRAQCRANGLWGSLTMNSQSAAADWIKTLCSAANAAPVFLGAKFYLIPYSEVSAVGNGGFYQPPTAAGPVADLDADAGDFLLSDCPSLDTAVRIDLPNVLQMQCIDRNANYAQVSVQTPDPATLGLYGVRKADPVTNNAIQDPSIARTILGIQVRRNQYGGDVWSFSTTARWSLLSPMDLVTLTDELQGIVGVPVRITSYNEQDDGSFQATAEPFVYGMCAPTLLPVTSPAPNPVSTQRSAGNANAPVIFEPTPGLYPGSSGDQLWVVVSSADPNYGGAQVFVSTDGGASYSPAPGGADGNSNVVIGSAVTGEVVTDWPAANDPDTTNDLEVDLSESKGTLQSSSAAVENNLEVPCYVEGGAVIFEVGGVAVAEGDPAFIEAGGSVIGEVGTLEAGGTAIAAAGGGFGYELMTYAIADLTGPNAYTLKATGSGNFLRRSIFLAPSSSGVGVDHPAGSRFAVVGPSQAGILKMTMPPAYIGQVLYFKVCTFNTFGAALQSLGDVSPFIYVPTGVPGAA